MKPRTYIHAVGMINALGCETDAVAHGLFSGDTSGMVLEQGWLLGATARVGRARGKLRSVPTELAAFDCRNNRLLLTACHQIGPAIDAALQRYGRTRIGIVLGSSTSGIAEGEAAIAVHRACGHLPPSYNYLQQEIGTPAVFLARFLGLRGPAYTVSTACTSSAKVFSSARNLLRHGLCDAVITGGVDSLCKLTLNGFSALESTTPDLSNPISRNRRGINIGEGAALFVVSREPAPIEFLGIGESSDAHHISAPHPDGLGAETAMRSALADAGKEASAVDYINMHATATPKNDEMESRAIARVFPEGIAASGTKPLTGHLLGAAGATELAFCWLALRDGLLPPHIWDGQPDETLPKLDLVLGKRAFGRRPPRLCMSNSFAFGGSNTSLLIGDTS